jgi:hypothetical protein
MEEHFFYSHNYIDLFIDTYRKQIFKSYITNIILIAPLPIIFFLLAYLTTRLKLLYWIVIGLVILLCISIYLIYHSTIIFRDQTKELNILIERKNRSEYPFLTINKENITIPTLLFDDAGNNVFSFKDEDSIIKINDIVTTLLLIEVKNNKIKNKTYALLLTDKETYSNNEIVAITLIRDNFTLPIERLMDYFFANGIPVNIAWSRWHQSWVFYEDIIKEKKPRYILRYKSHEPNAIYSEY